MKDASSEAKPRNLEAEKRNHRPKDLWRECRKDLRGISKTVYTYPIDRVKNSNNMPAADMSNNIMNYFPIVTIFIHHTTISLSTYRMLTISW